MNALFEFIKSKFVEDKTETAPLPPRHPVVISDAQPARSAFDPPDTPDARGTLTKSLAELEQARIDAALIEPLGKPVEDYRTSSLHRHEKPMADLLSLTLGQRSTGSTQTFIPLPGPRTGDDPAPGLFTWRIELCGLGIGTPSLGFDILGDVVIGRGDRADIDLESFGAVRKGVSRRHALLRPTALRLYLIDLGSTNGTYFNSVQLGHSATRALRHDDVITLGALSFAVKIIDSPATSNRQTG